MTEMTALFAAALVVTLAIKLWLTLRQMRHVALHRHRVPAAFEPSVPLHAHRRAADYTLARGRLALVSAVFGTLVLLGWTLLGGLDALNGVVRDAVQPRFGDLPYQLALMTAFILISSLLDLPFELYTTFRLEQRFGFNRMTWKLFLTDSMKSLAVGAVIGLPLLAGVLWIMGTAGRWWWAWAWAGLVGFQLLVMVIYPTVIAPLFNTFKPLDDEALKARVQGLMSRCGFAAKGLFVMDGSRRSAHGNAYFTGLGAAKRVVFFDTLLSKLSPSEVEAVLAHELGHFKHRHVQQRLVMMFGVSLAGLAALGWLSQQAWFFLSLGVEPNMLVRNDALALLLFMLAVPPFGFLLSPLAARLSRKHEFEADAYAARQASSQDLANALIKLHEDNAATLTPDPIYVRFYYSHPPASERLAALASAR